MTDSSLILRQRTEPCNDKTRKLDGNPKRGKKDTERGRGLYTWKHYHRDQEPARILIMTTGHFSISDKPETGTTTKRLSRRGHAFPSGDLVATDQFQYTGLVVRFDALTLCAPRHHDLCEHARPIE